MSQIVHCPAVFDDEERYPFGDVLFEEDPYSKNQGERFDDPKDRIEGFFVAGFGLVIGDVLQELPHEADLARGTPAQTSSRNAAFAGRISLKAFGRGGAI
jgi:hypothetical protein